MKEFLTTIAPYFTGKGSTIRLAIFGSLCTGTIYEVMEAKYNVSATSNDKSISFAPTAIQMEQPRPLQQLQQDPFVPQESGINLCSQSSIELPPETQQG